MTYSILILVLAIFAPMNPLPVRERTMIVTAEECEAAEWSEFHAIAQAEYADEFTALFNSYEVKHAKNGALMIRQGNSGSFKFCKKG